MEQKKTPSNMQKINIELDEKAGSGEYSNFVVVTHSPAEFVIDFTRILPGLPKAKVHSRIIMAPPHVKSFMLALKDNIIKFEKKYGEIIVHQQEGMPKFSIKPPDSELPN